VSADLDLERGICLEHRDDLTNCAHRGRLDGRLVHVEEDPVRDDPPLLRELVDHLHTAAVCDPDVPDQHRMLHLTDSAKHD
jgi:hypothetical protein